MPNIDNADLGKRPVTIGEYIVGLFIFRYLSQT